MNLRKLLHSFITSSSLYPLSKYYKCCFSKQRNHGALLYYSTASSTLSVEPTEDTLFRRLVRVSRSKDSIVCIHQWLDEGRAVNHDGVRRIIREFRHYKRFALALRISEWMNDSKYFNLTPGDAAVQLDLISKVRGLEQAEKFFQSMPDESIPLQIYGSLLNCYADAKALDKAEVLMEKMRKLGFAKILSYNVMLNLYSQMGKHDKFNFLVQEMEDKGISNDRFTYNIRLSAYSAAADIMGMEKLLMKMEADPWLTMDCDCYGIAADGYLKAGAFEKAKMVLKKFEQLIRGRSTVHAYRILITLYARMGRKDEVYRIWNKHKNSGKFHNMSYITVISSLVKLDELDGAEQILEEWQEKMKVFDSRVPHVLLIGYCKNGHMEKAESLICKLIENGNEPNSNTWSRLAWGYSKNNQMEKAVDMIEKAITTSHQDWKPDLPTLAHCLEYLNSNVDADRAKKIIGLLEEHGKFSGEFRDRLGRYIRKEKLASKEFDEMEQEAETLEAEEIFGDIGFQSKSTS